MENKTRTPTLIDQSAAVLGGLVFLLGVVVFAYTGTFARYWADDYCYSAVARDGGLLGSIWEWYRASGNRFSTIFMVSISEWFGSHAIRYIPAFVLAAWTAGWGFFLARLTDALGWKVPRRWAVLLGLAEVFYCVLLAPDRLQSVYWRLGTLHYTFPLALLLANLGWMAGRRRQGGFSWGFAVLSGLLAFFAGGFSETFAALQTGLLGLVIAGLWLMRREGRGGPGLAAGALGSLLAMGVMALSPSNAWRQAAMPPPSSLLDLVTYSLRYAVDFTGYSLRGQPLPLLIYTLTVGLAGFLVFEKHAPRVSPWLALAGVPLSLGLGFALVVCVVAPSSYAGLLYPAGRALMPGRFAFLLGWGGAALCAAAAARTWTAPWKPETLRLVAALLLLAACAYPLRALPLQRAEIALMQVKAARFDERDAQIRAARAAGVMNIEVREVDVVQTLEDLGPDVDYWVNVCARAYYQVSGIWAKP